jgi:CRP-like cAMP-binding protein
VRLCCTSGTDVLDISPGSIRNRLLRALSPHDLGPLLGRLHRTPMEQKQVIAAPNQPLEIVCFPEGGIVSILAVTSDGRKLEAGLYGWEGCTGAAVALGVDRTPHEHVVQAPGTALTISTPDLLSAMDERPAIRALLLRYAQTAIVQTSYTVLSNGSYTINERLARWLLMCDDRSDDGVRLTHEFLSQMLGVRRPSVTLALQTLEGMGLIRAVRAHITVLDRPGLQAMAGDSYGTPEAEYARLIGLPI